MQNIQLFIKRLVDFFGSLVGIAIIMPILVAIAIAVKLTSEGPVFFIQKRLGKNGKVFNIIKFRTMVVDAESLGAGIHLGKNDDRITKIGHFLRNYSLDELPQLFNVLKGEMSLVGPRPLLPHFPKTLVQYNEEERIRFLMRPGITGLAQVNGRGSIGWDEKFSYDIKYVSDYSLQLDLHILFRTVGIVIGQKNIYKDEESGVNIEK